jgi:outer membrane protein OmpA-like peptidoglycan-associated protein
MVAERRGQYWNEPTELPAGMNTGNATYPRIQGDNQTLIFSSDRPGGKGMLDFYLSRYENGSWQNPVNMSYLNTTEDDHFVSIPLSGNIAYYSMMYRGNYVIIKAQIPDDMKPSKVNFIDGKVTANGEPVEVFLQLYDFESDDPVQYGRNNKDGSFQMIVPEGKNYDFSATPTQEGIRYFAKIYELEEMESSKWERATIELESLSEGNSWTNQNIKFLKGTANLSPTSDYEMKRLIKLLRNNPDLNLTLEVYTDEVIEDTVQSDPDLTEIRQDTIEYQIDYLVIDTVFLEMDSLIEVANEEMQTDTLSADEFFELGEEPDFELDSMYIQVPKKKVIDIYHNDRTYRQAETLSNFFREKGVPEGRFIVLGLGDINNIVENNTEEDREKNRRVEVRLE